MARRRRRRISRRTRIVWAAFAIATTLVTGVLILGDGGAPRGLVAASQGSLEDLAARRSGDPVQPREAALDRARWKGIVIHHSGSPVGDPDAIERQHLSYGYTSLGYHFVIGNGHGYGDGVIHVGSRWNRQQPGAHVGGADGPWYNEHTIGICLVGNGDRRPFTARQTRELVALVRRLQQSLGLPAGAVQLHGDITSGSSPGRFFPAAEFEAQLLR